MLIPGFIYDSTANFVRPPAVGFGLRLYGATSGSVGLKPAAAAGSTDFTLPPSTTAGGVPTDVAGNGVLTMVVPAGGASLSGLTAATGANTIANGTFSGQVWNWALTADSVSAMTFGETTAATGGTSTSGVPNQVIGKFTTLAGSTASPLSVYSRGSHVCSVSPTDPQLLMAAGSGGTPSISFVSGTTAGFSYGNINGIDTVSTSVNGTRALRVSLSNTMFRVGTAAAPSVTDSGWSDSGLFWNSESSVLGISINLAENSRFVAGAWRASCGADDAVSYAINARKSRGSVASPTVITTGDDLLTVSGYGYVGATNTYVQAAKILIESTGTIADTTTGIGGVFDFQTMTVGSAIASRFKISENKIGAFNTTPVIQPVGALQAAITNSTGGTQDGTLVDVTTTGLADPVKVNNNFTDVFALLDAIRTGLVNLGWIKGAA